MPYKQYPKPLSEKTLQNKYSQLNLSTEKIEFIKQFILACANLYGRISIKDIWEVYKKLASITVIPKIKRTDIIQLSELLRREELPYYVYEVDELYSEEIRQSLNREFVSKYLVGAGWGKLTWYYRVAESQARYDYYVPDNLLSFTQAFPTKQEQQLLEFLGKLKVTANEYKDRFGITLKCPDHKGETLNSFSFMNNMETFNYRYAKGEIQGIKGNPKEAKRLLNEYNSKTEAEKIIDQLKWYSNIGHVSPIDTIQFTLDELGEAGVELTEQQLNKLTQGVNDLHNNSYLMCLSGWRPVDLMAQTKAPTAISFGPNIKKSIADGTLDKEELVKLIKDKGLEYLDD